MSDESALVEYLRGIGHDEQTIERRVRDARHELLRERDPDLEARTRILASRHSRAEAPGRAGERFAMAGLAVATAWLLGWVAVGIVRTVLLDHERALGGVITGGQLITVTIAIITLSVSIGAGIDLIAHRRGRG